ncbi:hypothetical protein ATO6_23665 [Oceanicola sp. 22II-s10i]|uniref:type II secretion system minor pseudopilin GspK n=1 Tax=Oceanicola sp. 22II-s10i TaxID=1317116 RepID=UPI000B527A73|nr:type II secretion system minor pseudopilin GspK [Oceanicola sp. 22II-s10i]OWU81683.1 hypothetical protein ATO6_23665 [Oceanicola sp. 22II-s10i]
MRRERGFVLVNALIIVAVLSAAAVYLLARAEGTRARLAAGQEAARLTLALDAFEALALTRIGGDRFGGQRGVDSLDEDWARPVEDLPLEGLRISGRITDMQGLFNLNWLTQADDPQIQAAFDRLLRRIGVSSTGGRAIREFLSPGGPDDGAYAALTPPLKPVGGAVLMVEQVAQIPGLAARDLDRLRPFVTAYADIGAVNVNTAPPEVLAALLPGVPAARLDRALAGRVRAPYPSVDAFTAALGGLAGAGEDAAADEDGQAADADGSATPGDTETLARPVTDRLGVGSDWFRAEMRVDDGPRSLTRVAVIRRGGTGTGPRVEWRLTGAP